MGLLYRKNEDGSKHPSLFVYITLITAAFVTVAIIANLPYKTTPLKTSPSPQKNKITVSGTATFKVKNTEADIEITIKTTSKNKEESIKKTKQNLDDFMSWVKNQDSIKDIKTSSIDSSPLYSTIQNTSTPNQLPTIIGETTRARIFVTIESKNEGVEKKAGEFLAEAQTHGATSINGPNFHPKNGSNEENEIELLKKAFNNAKNKSLALAEASNQTLESAADIQENINSYPAPMSRSMNAMSVMAIASSEKQAAPYSLEAGEETLTATINVTFSMSQKKN